jgi:Ca2+-binding RTX toxin-like protein
MSYFGSRETGAATYDFANLQYLYPATPMVHDIKAIQDIYGAETTTRTGDTVYGFNSNTDRPAIYDFNINKLPVLCIWDSAGNDTLDFSGWNSNSIIDLNPGSFSSGGGSGRPTLAKYQEVFGNPNATEADIDAYLALRNSPDGMLHDNVSIAYGAIIENAVGGGGNDRIYGNSVANRIQGGGGVDVVTLGGGNDVFVAEIAGATSSLKTGNMTVDIITDFSNGDKIDLGNFDNLKFKGSAATKGSDVTFKVYDSINGAENALKFDIDGHSGASVKGKVTVVYINHDGGTADEAIILLNHNGVSAGDFIFG